jgi:two-component system sensor histidine kinase UhpB
MSNSQRRPGRQAWRFSLFEKVLLVNALMLVCEALVGLWVTSHSLESHHYLIDTTFIVGATVLTLGMNIFLLYTSFRPLYSLLKVIRAIGAGATELRANNVPTDTEIGELAGAFNTMLNQLAEMHRAQKQLIVQVQEEERSHFALELHDESSQNLTALLVHVEILKQSLQGLPADQVSQSARDQLHGGLLLVEQLAQNILEDIRTISQRLRPGVLDDMGLHAALRWLAEESRSHLKVPVSLHLEPVEEFIRTQEQAQQYETTLFRIAQESVTNAARHGHAAHITVQLQRVPQGLCLLVQDDGCGFDPGQIQHGLGIAGMRERASLLKGTLQVRSDSGQGTTVEACLPLHQSGKLVGKADPQQEVAHA